MVPISVKLNLFITEQFWISFELFIKNSLFVYENKGYDVITVKNRIASSVLEVNPDMRSTKEDDEKHGFGVKQIKETVELYEGMTDFYEEDGYFMVNIFIPK